MRGNVAVWALGVLAACTGEPAPPAGGPHAAPDSRYVSDARCGECHAAIVTAWQGSHHDLAMQIAGPDSVVGDFDDGVFSGRDGPIRFQHHGARYFITVEDREAPAVRFEVTHTFGVTPLQQYLVAMPGGRLQSFSIAWDTRPVGEGGQRWLDLAAETAPVPGDPLHWTGAYQTWNLQCAECHSTAVRRGYDLERDGYQTTWAEMDVGCQACHGPGAAHVAWARSAGEAPDAGGVGLRVDFHGDARQQVDECGRCHARRHSVSAGYEPGEPFLDHFSPALLEPPLYHADGQIREEVYVYGSFLQSRMYQQGVRCTDCHDPHTLGTVAAGNALCTRCHASQPDPRFPTLQGKLYDSPEHHFHAQGSEAARCVTCHMPARVYMRVDPRRDHNFRLPRPDLSASIGTPDVCTGCHEDRDAAWAAQALAVQHGPPSGPHYGQILAAAETLQPEALPQLIALAGDEAQPAIVRATALGRLAGYGSDATQAILAGAVDAEALVRSAAVRASGQLPEPVRVAVAIPALRDVRRAVRSEAAWVLSNLPPERLDAADREAFSAALLEYEAAQRVQLDTPGAQFNLGLIATRRGAPAVALEHYRAALRIDSGFAPAALILAELSSASGGHTEAEAVLRAALERVPDQGDLHYALGLLLVERGRPDDAANALNRAAKLLPRRARVHYNYGLLLERLGRRTPAEAALGRALALEPDDPDVLYALVSFHANAGEFERAIVLAERLAGQEPDDADRQRLLRRLRAAAAARESQVESSFP